MNLFERRNAIMKTLRKEGHTTVASLAKKFDVSERTIRTLWSRGNCAKIAHGGT